MSVRNGRTARAFQLDLLLADLVVDPNWLLHVLVALHQTVVLRIVLQHQPKAIDFVVAPNSGDEKH